MLITLIHPSRGRPEKSASTIREWVERAGVRVQVIVSVDDDDDYVSYSHAHGIDVYQRNWPGDNRLVISQNTSVVEATNKAAKIADGDILAYVSDDFSCPENWGEQIIREFDGATGPRLVKVDDCLQPFHVRVLTIPFMNKALYHTLGYFWHPQYKSMFVDEDLWHTANRLGALWSAPHLKFEHKHVSVGKAEDDETYRRSSANWNQGKEVFERRKRMGFPV